MLVLSRKVGDVIAIGDNIKIVVMSIKGKQVKLGIEADKSTVVHREEVYQKIKQENGEAAKNSVNATLKAKELLNGNIISPPPEKTKKVFIRKKDSE